MTASIVVGLVTGTEKTKLEVGTGDYNKMIDKRIAEIKKTCGIK
jgi:NADPH-dependent curcumin reductase CurA